MDIFTIKDTKRNPLWARKKDIIFFVVFIAALFGNRKKIQYIMTIMVINRRNR
jgi:hypothetical protein